MTDKRTTCPRVLFILVVIASVVGMDLLFFRHQFWPRLLVNVGTILVFAAGRVRRVAPRSRQGEDAPFPLVPVQMTEGRHEQGSSSQERRHHG